MVNVKVGGGWSVRVLLIFAFTPSWDTMHYVFPPLCSVFWGGLGEGAVVVMGLPNFTGFSGFRQRLVQTFFGISFHLSLFFFVPNNRWVGVDPTPV